jgi:hypothetical protein
LNFIRGISVITICEFYELYCECMVGFLRWVCIVWMVLDT